VLELGVLGGERVFPPEGCRSGDLVAAVFDRVEDLEQEK